MTNDDELGPPEPRRAELSRFLGLQTDRIRGLPLARLERVKLGEEQSPADRIREGAQVLADLAADAEGRPRCALPLLATHGLGDQLAVVGHDLLRFGDAGALERMHEVLVAVRRAL